MLGSNGIDARVPLAINLELEPGSHGASARVELHEREQGTVALVSLRGWLDHAALGRLARTLDQLGPRGTSRLLLDCSLLRHIDVRFVAVLAEALDRLGAHRGGVAVCGLSHGLTRRLRAVGSERGWRCFPSAIELLSSPLALEAGREWAP